MTVRAAIRELEKIELIAGGRGYHMDVTTVQKEVVLKAKGRLKQSWIS